MYFKDINIQYESFSGLEYLSVSIHKFNFKLISLIHLSKFKLYTYSDFLRIIFESIKTLEFINNCQKCFRKQTKVSLVKPGLQF